MAGRIRVSGSKNAVLPMLAATLLTRHRCVITDVPDIVDVRNFLKILTDLGCSVKTRPGKVEVAAENLRTFRPDPVLVGSMRASVVLLGALLGRSRQVDLSFPGGDLIGARPIDVHLRAFSQMGAVANGQSRLRLKAKRLNGAEVFAESSVTGTENMILAGVLATGTTVIKLAALEPHVLSLCKFLKKMGARISGIGTHTLVIRGVKNLHGATSSVIPDMIEAGTFALLAAATKSQITITNVDHSQMDAVYHKMSEMGVRFSLAKDSLTILKPKSSYRAGAIRTGLYPNLATDLQPPFGVFATQCRGTSVVHDWIWEGRLGYLAELKKLGARVRLIDTHRAEITGPVGLKSGNIRSSDIRAGMTLLIAAIVARGKSVVRDIHHIDRGYEKIEQRLSKLGAKITRQV